MASRSFLCLVVSMMLSVNIGIVRAEESMSQCKAHANRLLNRINSGSFVDSTVDFDAKMKLQLTGDKLENAWQELIREYGELKYHVVARVLRQPDSVVVETRIRFDVGTVISRVTCDVNGKIAGIFFSPEASLQVKLANERDLLVPTPMGPLPGVLCVPVGRRNFPAVVMVQGSGPQDRDETIGSSKPFRDIAQGLCHLGIATLRYDKRTLIYGPAMQAHPETLTIHSEVTSDALSGVKVMRAQAGVDPKQIYVLGHSLGAQMAPWIGQHDSGVAGLILLAAPARPLQTLLLEQLEQHGELPESQLDSLRSQVRIIDRLDPRAPPRGPLLMDLPLSYWLSLRDYDPIVTAKSLMQPMLILQGENDAQVPKQIDFNLWRKAFMGDARVSFIAYPNLGHLFTTTLISGSGGGYTNRRVSPQVIEDVERWIAVQKGRLQVARSP